jgi:hypothetical protein
VNDPGTERAIGQLSAQVAMLNQTIRDNNLRLSMLEKELTKAKGIGLGIFLMAITGTSVFTSLVTRWMNP